MRKETWKVKRPYKLEHQVLAIKAINFETETLIGFVDMLLHPLSANFNNIFINCQQCLIHRVCIDDSYEPNFTYHDPTLNISPEPSKKFNLEQFDSNHIEAVGTSDTDSGGGELMIEVPNEMRNSLIELKAFRVVIEFSLCGPKGGMQFVVPDTDGTLLERGAHMFTYRADNSSRQWFPCLDSFSEVCTWKLEFTVDIYMVAVSCGDLTETIYTPDLRRKTYHYYLGVPTAAPNIALSIGPFEIWVDPKMHEVTNFCLPGLLPVLKHATAFLHEVFELYEELLSIRFPYSCYKQVFVNCAYEPVSSYATMSICSYSLLHSRRVIEQMIETHLLLSEAVANQFFGCFVSMNSWCDAWLAKGLSYLLSKTYTIKTFANNVHLHDIAKTMEEVCAYENQHEPVILDPGSSVYKAYPQTLSPDYLHAYKLKSHLVMRMLEKSVGREFMVQVMIKMLTLATAASKLDYPASDWSNMLLSTNSFLKHIFSVTGKDIQPFINQWVYQGGHVEIRSTFSFNRKRNTIELEIKQDLTGKNCMKYVGPISVVVQELDGSFPYQFLIEEDRSKFDIACHSKSRRQKKKKIPIRTGEEIDINFADTDEDSPVLWLRVDAEMALVRQVWLEQADFMWQLMLKHEKCVVYQLQAIKTLESFPSQKTQNALLHAIQQPRFYHRVREAACFCLAKVLSSSGLHNINCMLSLFLTIFKAPCCPSIVRRNNFHNYKLYFLQKSFVLAISKLRDSSDKCPQQVLTFLHDLLFYNDNTINNYTDSYYKATLIEALSNTVSPSISLADDNDGTRHIADGLESNIRMILQDVTRLFNMDKLIPSYRSVVSVSGLKAFRLLQRLRHLPREQHFLHSHARSGMFTDVRIASLEALVDVVAVESDNDSYNYLLDLLISEKNPYVRFRVVTMMQKNPPFRNHDNPLNSAANKNKLWDLLNCKSGHDSRMRGALLDLFRALYSKCKDVHEATHERKRKRDSKANPILDVCTIDNDQSAPSTNNQSQAGMDYKTAKRDSKFDHSIFKIDLFKAEESSEGRLRQEENAFPQISTNQHRLSLTQPSQIPAYQSDLTGFMVDDDYGDEVADVCEDGEDGEHEIQKKSKSEAIFLKGEGRGSDGDGAEGEGGGDLTLSESSSVGNSPKNKVTAIESQNYAINLSEDDDEEDIVRDREGHEPLTSDHNDDSIADVYTKLDDDDGDVKAVQHRAEEEDEDDDDFEEVTDVVVLKDNRDEKYPRSPEANEEFI